MWNGSDAPFQTGCGPFAMHKKLFDSVGQFLSLCRSNAYTAWVKLGEHKYQVSCSCWHTERKYPRSAESAVNGRSRCVQDARNKYYNFTMNRYCIPLGWNPFTLLTKWRVMNHNLVRRGSPLIEMKKSIFFRNKNLFFYTSSNHLFESNCTHWINRASRKY